MWNLNLERLESLLPEGESLGKIAIETGTCRGNGTRLLAKKFSRVITIELSKNLSDAARSRLRGEFKNIEFLNGESSVELGRMLPEISEPIFFFLDAHWSGDGSVDWSKSEWKGYGLDTAHLGVEGVMPLGPEQCPLAAELSAIVKHCRVPAWILIDDLKNIPPVGYGKKDLTFQGEDWSHLSREDLLSILGPRLLAAHDLKDPEQWLLQLGPF